eukprot:TRINITY_DN14561_c0_g1_i3.p1 TRINITY_DN14561_c0_g1~~TRINITY_DN14561_c0_g1_i3.p1  ORF type:complete len:231 (+),score=52.57 TRINITY_DN14561_c0_g1_i3:33-725(+)
MSPTSLFYLFLISMAWMCSGSSQKSLVSKLQKNGIIKTDRVASAMLAVDRAHYVKHVHESYSDSPAPIGFNATISAPHMHAYCLEYLDIQPGDRCLDVGSGSGYFTACMALLSSPTGSVIGVDHISELVDLSLENIKKGNPDLLHDGKIKIIVADGRNGYPPEAPYQKIHVGAACEEEPLALIKQLAIGGRLVAPVGQHDQSIVQYDKFEDGQVLRKKIMGMSVQYARAQ